MLKKNEDERFGWDFDRDKVTCFTCSLFSFILHTTQRHAQDRGSCKIRMSKNFGWPKKRPQSTSTRQIFEGGTRFLFVRHRIVYTTQSWFSNYQAELQSAILETQNLISL